MQETLSKFNAITERPYQRLAQWKKQTDRKIIGCFPMHIPEEIIHAAGILPVTLVGSEKAITLAHQYLPICVCHLTRENLDLALTGELDFLDGIVFPDTCDMVQCLPDIWNLHHPTPFYHNFVVAGKLTSPSARRYLVDQTAKLKYAVEEFINYPVFNKSLRQSIRTYNENRELLNRLYQVRRDFPSLLKARDTASIVMASMLMPKEEHNQLLTQLLKQLETTGKPTENKRVRLVVSGSLCDQPPWEVLDLIEELGGVIADDDLYVGRRYFATKVEETLNPIEALSEHYLNDIPCPTKHNQARPWAEYLVGLIKKAKAKGVIILIMKYCEPHASDYPVLKARLSQENVPHLLIELEPPLTLQQIRAQLETFIEMLKGGR